MKRSTLALFALVTAGIVGCDSYSEPAHVDVVTPAPAVDVYYEQGYYDGPYWVYHDREGHIFREERAIHERRAADIRERRGREGHEEHHEEHH
jgi:hypothetical protein